MIAMFDLSKKACTSDRAASVIGALSFKAESSLVFIMLRDQNSCPGKKTP
jgi:hypothetical protein